jgi:hypothetical protein
MRIFAVAAAAVTIMAASSFVKPAAAITLGGADGLRHAIEDTDLVDKVHCRPGWRHHWNGWRWWDGCYRYNYFYSYPRYRIGHRVHIGRSFVGRSHVSRSFTRSHVSRGISRSHVSRGISRSHGRRR